MLEKWLEIKTTKRPPPNYERWTEEDEPELVALKSSEIELKDTALGQLRATHEQELEASYKAASPGTRESIMSKLKSHDTDE